MKHFVYNTITGRTLFHTWNQGVRLYDALCNAAPEAHALVVMPNHIHLLARAEVKHRITACIQGHARWLNGREDTSGRLFQRFRAPTPISDSAHLRRTERYIWLNPPRKRLTTDPLAWPLSDYRDALGLSLHPHRPPARDPQRLHAYVTSDPSCDLASRAFPAAASWELRDALAAAAFLHRVPLEALQRRGPARALAIAAARAYTEAKPSEIAAALTLHPRSLRGCRHRAHPVVEKLIGDPRLQPLPAGRLDHLPWREWLTGQLQAAPA